jgi:ferredoxin
MIPRVDVFKCNGCGVCVKRCPAHIMGLIKNKAALLMRRVRHLRGIMSYRSDSFPLAQ